MPAILRAREISEGITRREFLKSLLVGAIGTALAMTGIDKALTYAPPHVEAKTILSKESVALPFVFVYRDGDKAVAIDGLTRRELAKSDEHIEVLETVIEIFHERAVELGADKGAFGYMFLLGEFKLSRPLGIKYYGPLVIAGPTPCNQDWPELYLTKLVAEGDFEVIKIAMGQEPRAHTIHIRNIGIVKGTYGIITERTGWIFIENVTACKQKIASFAIGDLGPDEHGNKIMMYNCYAEPLPDAIPLKINHDHVFVIGGRFFAQCSSKDTYCIVIGDINEPDFLQVIGPHVHLKYFDETAGGTGLILANTYIKQCDTCRLVVHCEQPGTPHGNDQIYLLYVPDDAYIDGGVELVNVSGTENEVWYRLLQRIRIPDSYKHKFLLRVGPIFTGDGVWLVSAPATPETPTTPSPAIRLSGWYWSDTANIAYKSTVEIQNNVLSSADFELVLRHRETGYELYKLRVFTGLKQAHIRPPAGWECHLGAYDVPFTEVWSKKILAPDNTPLKLYSHNANIEFYDRFTGNLLAKIKKDGRFTIKRVDIGDYGGNFANYTPPTDAEDGDILIAIDTNATAPGARLYIYANGQWWYVSLSS